MNGATVAVEHCSSKVVQVRTPHSEQVHSLVNCAHSLVKAQAEHVDCMHRSVKLTVSHVISTTVTNGAYKRVPSANGRKVPKE